MPPAGVPMRNTDGRAFFREIDRGIGTFLWMSANGRLEIIIDTIHPRLHWRPRVGERRLIGTLDLEKPSIYRQIVIDHSVDGVAIVDPRSCALPESFCSCRVRQDFDESVGPGVWSRRD